MKKRLNNKGFTLAELIIAIAILAIAVIPLVANFIQSSKINSKGRQDMNAMNLAQDMMEGISVYTADDLKKKVEKTLNESNSLVGVMFPTGASHALPVKITEDSTTGKYSYEVKSVKTVTSDGKYNVYDAIVSLNPTGDEHKSFNKKELANISEMNQYYDAIYYFPEAEIAKAVGELHYKSNYSVDSDSYYGNIVRTIKLNITDSGVGSDVSYSVNVSNEYEVVGDVADNAGLTGEKYQTNPVEISRMPVTELPENIYIYFEGMQNATSTATPIRDKIEINSSTGKPVTVYLIRTQKENGTYSSDYKCEVRIVSKDKTQTTNTQDVSIVSNLRYDLNATKMRYNFRTTDEDGNPIPADKIVYPLVDDDVKVEEFEKEGKRQTNSTYKKTRADYYYNGSLINEAIYKTNFSAGYAKKEKNTLYKVTIELYDPTTGNKVATYNGGLSN